MPVGGWLPITGIRVGLNAIFCGRLLWHRVSKRSAWVL